MSKFFKKEEFYFIGFFISGIMFGFGVALLFQAGQDIKCLTRIKGVEIREANACIEKLKLMQNECMKANRKVE